MTSNYRRLASSSVSRALRSLPGRPALFGAAAGIALAAGVVLLRQRQHRRYSDHAQDRRHPMSLFSPGLYFRRRQIDRSGAHPLFERREAAYDAY